MQGNEPMAVDSICFLAPSMIVVGCNILSDSIDAPEEVGFFQWHFLQSTDVWTNDT